MRKVLSLSAIIGLLLLGPAGSAAMEPITHSEMDEVTGESGIQLAVSDVKVYFNSPSGLRIQDSTLGNEVGVSGMRGLVSVNSKEPVTLDVFTSPDNRPMLGLQVARWEQQVSMEADSVALEGKSLGALRLDYPVGSDEPSSMALYTTPLDSGIGLQLELQTHLEKLQLYSLLLNVAVSDLRLAGSVTDTSTGDIKFGGPTGMFRVGDLNPTGVGIYNPMEIHVAEDPAGAGFLRIDAPMQGSIRIDDITANIGENLELLHFGPLYLEGINAPKLQIDLKAG